MVSRSITTYAQYHHAHRGQISANRASPVRTNPTDLPLSSRKSQHGAAPNFENIRSLLVVVIVGIVARKWTRWLDPIASTRMYHAYCHAPLQYHYSRRAAIVEKREHMFLRAMSKAMRYYRVWIYSCNVALFLGTFVYFVAFLTVISDWRLNFFTNIRLYQPTFIYAYCAIIVQGGILQTIGCVGAIKLNERYLNFYLMTLFVLLFGDAITGIVWVLRYNATISTLKSDLKAQIADQYKIDRQLQELWDEFQANSQCCGVDGPADYNTSSWASQFVLNQSSTWVLPLSCCHPEEPSFGLPHNECIIRVDDEHIFKQGCYEKLHHWLETSADLLSVLGFCVITFVKMCFLCLLRYEIKEMIDKIKVIKGQTSGSTHMLPFQDLEAYLPRPSMQQDTLLNTSSTNQTSQGTYRSTGAITEKCHCRLGVTMTTNLGTALSGSRMILSTSTSNLTGCQSKKHSLV